VVDEKGQKMAVILSIDDMKSSRKTVMISLWLLSGGEKGPSLFMR